MLLLLLFAAPEARLVGGDVVVTGLSPEALAAKALTLYVEPRRPGQPAVLGGVRADKGALVFTPRFPLTAGLTYRAVAGKAELVLALPEVTKTPSTTVTVYPSAATLPENQLKFYLHFSAPMTAGDSYRHIKLLDDKGKAVDLPFLELDQELWDPAGRRFTLFFDPGRIKRGLKPREEFGPALIEGKTYTLVVDRGWHDADGTPLKETFRKTFAVAAPDDAPPDVKAWKLDAGAALRVTFPEPMEHALLHRLLWVTTEAGERVPGAAAVSERETVWTFTPAKPWRAGAYRLVADTRLEDLAGNGIGRPFEVDLLRPVERAVPTKTVAVPFRVR